jgi:AhpC/TSA family/Thiol:disulfide interchange protein DsbD, N-terminal
VQLKAHGLAVATVSYDPPATLKRFAEAHQIAYPMLSDKGSAVIRAFGILNTNIPEGHPFYGIPFPGEYLLARDGTVRDKFFLPDYQTRVTASEVLLKDFGAAVGKNTVVVKSGDVEAALTLSDTKAAPGHELGVIADFTVASGWHIYGEPLPANYVPTTVVFDSELVAKQSWDFPPAVPMNFAAIGETLPVYEGIFRANGNVLIKSGLKPGDYQLRGTLKFQECNDTICKVPEAAPFALPLKIEPMVGALSK